MLQFAALKALPWRMIGLAGLTLAFVAMVVALKLERAETATLKANLESCEETRRQLAKQTKAKQAETSRRIEQGNRDIQSADGRAKRVETAPLPGGCRTPEAVLQADI
jgi:hypothetical protein